MRTSERPAVLVGDVSVRPVARSWSVRVSLGPATGFASYARADRLEIVDGEGRRRIVSIPDIVLQVRLMVAVLIVLSWVMRRRS